MTALAVVIAIGMAFPTGSGGGPNRSWGSTARGRLPPDIILILTDDQRADTLRWMPFVRQHIVRAGTWFPHAMVPTSTCCPSRASILTGLFAHGTRVWSNGNTKGVGPTGGWVQFHEVGNEDRTVATWLDAAGYHTVLVGKYLNQYEARPAGYRPPGWDRWHAFAGFNAAYYRYDLQHTTGETTSFGAAPHDYSTDVLRRFAESEIKVAPDGDPLFLMFAPYAPHAPALAAPRHEGTSPPLESYRPPSVNERAMADKPGWLRDRDQINIQQMEAFRRRQYEALRGVDEAVAGLFRTLRRQRGLRNTLILFLGDNGVLWGEHRLRGKYVPYEGAGRIPLAMRWTGHVPAGVRRSGLALNVDVPATIADAAGVDAGHIDGRSLLDPVGRGGFVLEATASRPHNASGAGVARPAYCGWRTARFLFVRYTVSGAELYDYRLDPWELRNVADASRYASRRSDLRRRAAGACDPEPPGFRW